MANPICNTENFTTCIVATIVEFCFLQVKLLNKNWHFPTQQSSTSTKSRRSAMRNYDQLLQGLTPYSPRGHIVYIGEDRR